MRWISGWLAISLCVIGISGEAAARPKTVSLEPSSKWVVNYGETACMLRRGFGTGENLITLSMERFGPSNAFQLSATGKVFGSITATTRLTILMGQNVIMPLSSQPTFNMGTSSLNGDTIPLLLAGQRRIVSEDFGQPVTPEIEKSVSSLTFRWGAKDIVLQTGPMDEPFAALRTCTDDLLVFLGLDPKVQHELKAPPCPKDDPADWIKDGDYPLTMMMAGRQAHVTFRLLIDSSGNPTNCAILRSFNEKVFDDRTCALIMKRARFTPALDNAGKPVASYYVNRVRWLMS